MEIIKLKAGECMGDWRIGTASDDFRKQLNVPFRALEEERDTLYEGYHRPAFDYFPALGLKAEYDQEGNVSFLEVDRRHKLHWEGGFLFEHNMADWLLAVKKKGKVEMFDLGFSLPQLGISFYSRHFGPESPDVDVELISIFKPEN